MHVKLLQSALLLFGAAALGVMQPAPSAPVSPAALLRPLPAYDGALLAYVSPDEPEPNEGDPDPGLWVTATKQVFAYVRNDNINGFMRLISSRGLWLTGLQSHTAKMHVTATELSQDLHRHGSLYRSIFLDHRSGNFVVSPDDKGHVQDLILK